ncbi:MAG TPA: FMN-binding negative transcriptional regulator [Allosphingosinicella sp.]|jgi:transcriptional regulator|uniref:FMN-binding negative transcriptional regulator n=1 Tax=Allosphingosinicella sp. TaxID=2823234 RepID=UPI002F2A34EF
MHPNPKFRWQDREAMAVFVQQAGFGTLFAQTAAGPRAVQTPALLEGDRLRFHIARGNAIHRHLAAGPAEALYVVSGADAYVSPDWYGMADRVPTWNYVAVELEGTVRSLDRAGLVEQLDDLSAEHEARLAPKRPWTRAKMSEARFEALLGAISGFEMEIADWRGTLKLGQDKPAQARAAVADALSERGDTRMAALMRTVE